MKNKRIIVTHYGGPDALQVVEENCSEPNRLEVRVKVLAAGVSLPDVMAREGIHPETPAVPFTPGWDLIGTVDELGDGVTGVAPGQMVAAMPISGAYAEFVCLPERELIPVPSGLDAAEAVSLILNYITAYQMLHRSATVRAGERVLIHGASVLRMEMFVDRGTFFEIVVGEGHAGRVKITTVPTGQTFYDFEGAGIYKRHRSAPPSRDSDTDFGTIPCEKA